MPKIETMFAFITEEKPDDEGIIAAYLNHSWMPLVGADMARVEALRKFAQETADMTGKKVTLVEFSVRKDIETIMPCNQNLKEGNT